MIKQLFSAYTSLKDIVLNIFAETGQIACAVVDLGLSFVFIKKDPI